MRCHYFYGINVSVAGRLSSAQNSTNVYCTNKYFAFECTSKYIFIIRSNLYIDIVTIPNLLPIINSCCEIRFVLVHKNVDFSDTYTII